MLAIDPLARSSMWDDLARGRPTEIDDLQGAVLRLAALAGTAAPTVARVAAPSVRAGGKGVNVARVLRQQGDRVRVVAPTGGVTGATFTEDLRRAGIPLVATQVLSLVQSALLAFFTLTGLVNFWIVLVLAACQGVINAFDTPARQAFVIEMVESREDLPNAIALNSTLVNVARLLGPSIAGALIATVGEGWCFTADALSYVAVVASLLLMTGLRPRPSQAPAPVVQSMREGWAYVKGFAPIRALLLLLALLSFTGVPYVTLMPVVATHVLGGGPHTLGLLMGASGLGAVAGALWMAQRPSVVGLTRVVAVSSLLFAGGLIAFSFSTQRALSMALLAITGGGTMVGFAAANTMIQTLTDEDKRGRVMSFYTLAFFGVMPLSSLACGALADRIGSPRTILASGIVALGGVALFIRALPKLRPIIRPIYEKLGILPAVATGLQQAAEAVERE